MNYLRAVKLQKNLANRSQLLEEKHSLGVLRAEIFYDIW